MGDADDPIYDIYLKAARSGAGAYDVKIDGPPIPWSSMSQAEREEFARGIAEGLTPQILRDQMRRRFGAAIVDVDVMRD